MPKRLEPTLHESGRRTIGALKESATSSGNESREVSLSEARCQDGVGPMAFVTLVNWMNTCATPPFT